MNGLKAPALAIWLLNRFAPVDNQESLVGDLIEQHRRGRSSAWFWRQAVSVIVPHLAGTLWRHKWVAVGVVALNATLPHLFRSFIFHWAAVVDAAWYPRLMQWLIETRRITVFHAAYGLTTGLTAEVAWCALIFSVAWIFVRLQAEARRTVVTLLVLLQIGQCVPGLWESFVAWRYDPADLTGFLLALRFAVFAFAAIPLSILLGGRVASWQGDVEPAV